MSKKHEAALEAALEILSAATEQFTAYEILQAVDWKNGLILTDERIEDAVGAEAIEKANNAYHAYI